MALIDELQKAVERNDYMKILELLAGSPELRELVKNWQEVATAAAANILAKTRDPATVKRVVELLGRMGLSPPSDYLDAAVYNIMIADWEAGKGLYEELRNLLPANGYAATYYRLVTSGFFDMVRLINEQKIDEAARVAKNVDWSAVRRAAELGILKSEDVQRLYEFGRLADRYLSATDPLEKIAYLGLLPSPVRDAAKALIGADPGYAARLIEEIRARYGDEYARMLASAYLARLGPHPYKRELEPLYRLAGVEVKTADASREVDKAAKEAEELASLFEELMSLIDRMMNYRENLDAAIAAGERILAEWSRYRRLVEAGVVSSDLRSQVEKALAVLKLYKAWQLMSRGAQLIETKPHVAAQLKEQVKRLLEDAARYVPEARAALDIYVRGVDPMEVIRCAMPVTKEVVEVGPRPVFVIR